MTNTPKTHLNFKIHPKLCLKPKHNPHTNYIQKTHNSHKNLQRARPIGLANIKNQTHKRKKRKSKEKNNKTETQQKIKNEIKATRQIKSKNPYQHRPIKPFTPPHIKLKTPHKTKWARPTGLANIEKNKHKKTKKINLIKTKTHQITKTLDNTSRHKPPTKSSPLSQLLNKTPPMTPPKKHTTYTKTKQIIKQNKTAKPKQNISDTTNLKQTQIPKYIKTNNKDNTTQNQTTSKRKQYKFTKQTHLRNTIQYIDLKNTKQRYTTHNERKARLITRKFSLHLITPTT